MFNALKNKQIDFIETDLRDASTYNTIAKKLLNIFFILLHNPAFQQHSSFRRLFKQ